VVVLRSMFNGKDKRFDRECDIVAYDDCSTTDLDIQSWPAGWADLV
jgi:hypothetical protein